MRLQPVHGATRRAHTDLRRGAHVIGGIGALRGDVREVDLLVVGGPLGVCGAHRQTPPRYHVRQVERPGPFPYGGRTTSADFIPATASVHSVHSLTT